MEAHVTDPVGAYNVRQTKSRMPLATIEDAGELKKQTAVAYCDASPGVVFRCRPVRG